MPTCKPWLACAALAAVLLASPAGAEDPPAGIKVRPEKEPYNPYKHVLPTDQLIRTYQDAVKRDPRDARSLTQLAQAYVRRARESGDFASYDLAEGAVRRALVADKTDDAAHTTLAVILCAQHKFTESLKLAREVYRRNPSEHVLLTVVGDALLELGDYREAEQAYRQAEKKDPRLWLHSRLARLAELKGQTEQALGLMQRAAEEEAPRGVTRESRAWHHFRLGEMHFNAGQLDKAARELSTALDFNPRYPFALAWLGKVKAALGERDQAIKLYGQAVAQSAEPFMLSDLGDLYAKAGKDFLAQLNYEKLEKSARGQDVYARELALYYANHGRNLADAVELARKDLAVRKDVYAYDTLAWALCQAGKYKEAAEAVTEALKLGTRDASLFYHAGMIYRGLGEKDKARDYLARALGLNPHFSLLQAEEARKALKELGGE